MRLLSLMTVGLTLFGSAAFAQSFKAAEATYLEGKWQESAKMALALNTSDGYALAARSYSMGAGLSPEGSRKAMFEQAQGYARKAIAMDARNPEAYFEMARAQGLLAQFSGIMQSLGLAGDMKKNLEKAASLSPNMAGAYVALGLWHANIESKGFAAKMAVGSDRAQILPNFQRAFKLEPQNAIHRIEFANALLVLGDKNGAQKQFQIASGMKRVGFWQELAYRKLAEKLKG